MTDHIARSGSWAEQKKWAVDDSDADCILELRARVERLEQAQQPESAAAEPAEPTDRMDMTLGELLRLNELWNAGEPGGRQLNLSGLDLRGADLSGTDLQDADLSGAFMRRANLTRANLRSANLHGASTRGAIGLPKPAPPAEPAPSTPAGLVSDVAALIADFASTSRAGDDCTPAASEVLHKVADWLLDKSATISSDLLRREVGR